MKKILSFIICVSLLMSVYVSANVSVGAKDAGESEKAYIATTGSASVPNDVYIKQAKSFTCTLAAVTNMIRARFYLSNNNGWSLATEDSVEYDSDPDAWIDGSGLRGSFTYYKNNSSVSINMTNVNGMSIATLKWLLDNHPEGVVIYSPE